MCSTNTARKTPKIKLRDVAARAGVSTMTVSNVINCKYKAMSMKTRIKVERAIKELNYRPNHSARHLKLSRLFTIGMIVLDRSPKFLTDPFITNIVAGLSNYLNSRGYSLMIQGLQPDNLSSSNLIQNIQTDGLCMMLSGSMLERKNQIESLKASNQPLLLFQQPPINSANDICIVRQDDHYGGRLLAELVIQKGARNLLMVAPEQEWPAVIERIEAIKGAVDDSGGAARLEIITCEEDFEETQIKIKEYLEVYDLPDAIMAANDQMAIAILRYLESRNIAIPSDVLLTGFNAFDFWKYTRPRLTSVASPAYQIGERGGAEILFRLVEGKFRKKDIVIPVKLQMGETA